MQLSLKHAVSASRSFGVTGNKQPPAGRDLVNGPRSYASRNLSLSNTCFPVC